jgi:hypothetical protein
MPLTTKLLILALAAQILLAILILVLVGRERIPSVMSGETDIKDIAVERSAYPLKARLLSNCFDNQFQLPVLFYVAVLLTLWTGTVSWLELVLAWAFVVLRYAHAAIHITTNHVEHRFIAYTAGLAVLCALWLWLVLRLVFLVPGI